MSGRAAATGESRICGVVGRDPELAILSDCIATRTSVVIRGVPGAGKSALVRAALELRPETLIVRGTWVLRSVPYLPLRRAMPSIPDRLQPVKLAGLIERKLTSGSVVAVDDLHWCDADTVVTLAEIAARRPLIVTVRPDTEANVEALVKGLLVDGTLIDLGPLTRAAATELVRNIRPAAPPSDVERWLTAADGNPLDLHLMAQGGSVGAGRVPSAAAVANLPLETLHDLARLALSGRPIRIQRSSKAELVRRGLIVVDGDGRAAPRHDAIAAAVSEAVGAETRARIHLELAPASESAAERAIHLAAGGDADGAVEAATVAAASAPTIWSSAEFLRLIAQQRTPPDRAAYLEAADALTLAGRYSEALELLDECAAANIADPRELVIRARAHWTTTDIDGARADIEAGLASSLTSDGQRAELLSLRSRIRCRVDWDLDAAIDDARRALDLTDGGGPIAVAAMSALGLALFMKSDSGWERALESAGRAAARHSDLHNAVTVYDTMIFGHLLSGDPSRCAPLALEMVEMTEHASASWNGYFRAIALLARLHVDGDHRAALNEAEHLADRRLTIKAAETLRTVRGLALIDAGRELDAVDLAAESRRRASDDLNRSMCVWVLAEALWIAGDAERAVSIADEVCRLPVAGFPGAVNAALAGAWARRDLGDPIGDAVVEATRSSFANLEAATHEIEGLRAASRGDPLRARRSFERAAVSWRRISLRASLRVAWAAAVEALGAGDVDDAVAKLRTLEDENRAVGFVWLDRRLDRLARDLGVRRDRPTRPLHSTADEVMARVSRGQTSVQVARALGVRSSTVETHLRRAMLETGARTRLHAAAIQMLVARPSSPTLTLDESGERLVIRSHPVPSNGVRVGLRDVPNAPWRLPSNMIATGRVGDLDDVTAAVLALVRGAHLDVEVSVAPRFVRDAMIDALNRVGDPPTVVSGTDDDELVFDTEDRRVVTLLAAGHSVAAVAGEIGWSRKTVQRRLALIRQRVGAGSNSEAVLRVVRRLSIPEQN